MTEAEDDHTIGASEDAVLMGKWVTFIWDLMSEDLREEVSGLLLQASHERQSN